MTWNEEYRPNTLRDVKGHQHHVEYLVEWAEAWQSGFNIEDKALILYGQAGVGKTSIAHALANEMEWDIIELNASDQRTAGIINRIAGSASKSGTFEGADSRKLIILDEADNMHGNRDRGGSGAIIKLIKNTSQPIILIVNNFYKLDISLRSMCKPLKFNKVNNSVIVKLLENICSKENIDVNDKVIKHIVQTCNGDVRAAINDLESICIGKDVVDIDDIVEDDNKRNVPETIFTFVDKVLKSNLKLKNVLELSNNIGESPENTIFWIDENLPLSHKNADELYDAYNLLSKADIFLGRVHKRQNYSLWKYANTIICGVSTVKKDKAKSGFIKYSPPKYFSKLKQSKQDRNIKKSIGYKVGEVCHISTEKVFEMLWFIKELMKDGEYSIIISYELDLNKNEIAYLFNCETNSERVKLVYEVVQELKQDDIQIDEVGKTIVSVKSVEDKVESKAQMNLMDF